MRRLEVRLFGGFDVRLAGDAVQDFESQKVRALFSYLASHRRQVISRDRLAALLWPDKADEAARRNLRQALHNLRSVFSAVMDPAKVFSVTHQDLQIHPQLDCWVDTELFESAVRRGLSEAGPDPYQLTVAASLYTGDFMAGFYVKECPPFEEWILTEQERLREAAIEAYRTLIEAYLRRGEYHIGIQYARRLLAVDPLSEGAHRYMMRLYSLAGRRSRALAQYEALRTLLQTELGVEPLEETTALFQTIVAQEVPTDADTLEDDEAEPAGPLIPMVGRGGAHERLEECWREVQTGRGRLTLVRGAAGVGKTRLVKSFVDAATSRRRAVVLRGRCYESAPLLSYQPFRELILSAFSELMPEEIEQLVDEGSPQMLANLLRIEPRLAELAHELAPAPADETPLSDGSLATTLLELAGWLAQPREGDGDPQPVILMLDDLQWADGESGGLLEELAKLVRERAVWIVGASRPGETDSGPALGAEQAVDLIDLEPLADPDVREIATSLTGPSGSQELGDFLVRWSGGLPLAVTELINLLWDEGILLPQEAGRWALGGSIDEALSAPVDLDRVIQLRVRRLPTSARRLLSIAAVVGQQFNAELVQKTDGEHVAVVDLSIQLMLERWLVRQSPASWSRTRRERDIVLWARGARRGTFEFAHDRIRAALLADVNPLRTQAMHRAVTRALREQGGDESAICELLAYHALAAGEWSDALGFLEQSGARAEALGAEATARWYYEKALQVVRRLASQVDADERERLEERGRRLEAALAAVAGRPAELTRR